MKLAYENLTDTIVPLIAKNVPSLKVFITFLQEHFQEPNPQLVMAKSFVEVMNVVKGKCTIVNIYYLEIIVNHYNIKEAKFHISAYLSTIKSFCEELKASVYESKNFVAGQLNYDIIEFFLEWEPDICTISDVKLILIKVFQDITKAIRIGISESE